MARIGLAISGGGYRAAAWGLGVTWYLADAGLDGQVTTVSSVSGGSLTNAYEGLRTGPHEPESRAFAQRLAGSPGGFGKAMGASMLVAAALAVALLLDWWAVAGGLVALLLVIGFVGSRVSGDLLFDRWPVWLYVDGALALLAVLVWSFGARWYCVVAAVVGLWLYLQLRGPVVGWGMGRSVERLAGAPGARLRDLHPVPERVILATELHAGHHACFGRDFVYCYDFGLGAKPGLPVRAAVQASANLPGAFPTRWMRTAGMGFVGGDHAKHPSLALTDGGVYDNMADQWHLGYPQRARRWSSTVYDPYRAVVQRLDAAQPDFMLVANASGALGWRKVSSAALPVIGELFGLLQVKDVLYDNGASVRRELLVGRFDLGDPAGTLVHIATNPYRFPKWAATQPALAARAATALAWLDGLGITDAQWEERMARARGVGTQLWPLGREATANVVLAAYVQAAVNLHIRLGSALPTPPAL